MTSGVRACSASRSRREEKALPARSEREEREEEEELPIVNRGGAACPAREGSESEELPEFWKPSRVDMKRGTAGLTLPVLALDPTTSLGFHPGIVRYSSIEALENLRGRLS